MLFKSNYYLCYPRQSSGKHVYLFDYDKLLIQVIGILSLSLNENQGHSCSKPQFKTQIYEQLHGKIFYTIKYSGHINR